jgi:hypothetical protein
VDAAEFEQITRRLADHGITTYADPGHREEGVDKDRAEGGRGIHWDDPDGNALEILTVPDGGWRSGHPRRPRREPRRGNMGAPPFALDPAPAYRRPLE